MELLTFEDLKDLDDSEEEDEEDEEEEEDDDEEERDTKKDGSEDDEDYDGGSAGAGSGGGKANDSKSFNSQESDVEPKGKPSMPPKILIYTYMTLTVVLLFCKLQNLMWD